MTARARRSSARATISIKVWKDLGTNSAILEAFVPFEREISVIAARARRRPGRMLRRHRKRAPRSHPEILAVRPRDISDALAAEARAHRREDRALRWTMSACSRSRCSSCPATDGRDACWSTRSRRACTNSGHWTLDGASISQFEQHIRAIAGWPLGKPVRHGQVTMTNLIGDDILDYEQVADRPRRHRASLRQGRAAARAARWAIVP